MIYLKKGRACLAPITGSHLSEHALASELARASLDLEKAGFIVDRFVPEMDRWLYSRARVQRA